MLRSSTAPARVAVICLCVAAAPACREGGGGETAPAPQPVASGPPAYVDVATSKGIDVVTWCGSPAKDHLLESIGSGAAFVDVDGDGHDDILVLSGWRLADREPGSQARQVVSRGRFGFYRNQGDGTFEDATARAGLDGGGAWAVGVAAGDIDGDGDLDLHVTCFGPDRLYRNRGDGTFEDVAEAAGVADPSWGGCAAFFDADDDGDLDLYVSNYIESSLDQVLAAERTLRYKGKIDVMAGPFGLPGAVDRFYRNRGDGTFEEAGAETGLVDRGEAYGLGVIAADLDDDGDVDVYVANDSNPNYLFRNEGGGRFDEMGVVSGAAFDHKGAAQAGMGLAVLDHDADGSLDLFVTNFADDASTLYRGEGKLFFEDISQQAGVAAPTYRPLSWGTAPVDFDGDGQTDLLVANGQIYPQIADMPDLLPYRQRCLLLRNDGGVFSDVSNQAGAGLAIPGSFRGLATGDIDGDGGEDLLLTRIDETPLLLRHEGGSQRRIAVAPSRPFPRWLGARIDVTVGPRTQSRVILSGGSFASQSSLRATFGLGAADKADRVVVRFPGGERQEFRDVRAGTVLAIEVPR